MGNHLCLFSQFGHEVFKEVSFGLLGESAVVGVVCPGRFRPVAISAAARRPSVTQGAPTTQRAAAVIVSRAIVARSTGPSVTVIAPVLEFSLELWIVHVSMVDYSPIVEVRAFRIYPTLPAMGVCTTTKALVVRPGKGVNEGLVCAQGTLSLGCQSIGSSSDVDRGSRWWRARGGDASVVEDLSGLLGHNETNSSTHGLGHYSILLELLKSKGLRVDIAVNRGVPVHLIRLDLVSNCGIHVR
jgi:hypothetical protein